MNYRSISTDQLEEGMVIGQPVFIMRGNSRWLLVPRNTKISSDGTVRNTLKNNKISKVVIYSDEEDTFLTRLQKSSFDPDDYPADLVNELHLFTRSFIRDIKNTFFLKDMASSPEMGEVIKEVILYIEHHPHLLRALMELRRDIGYLYRHSAYTCIMSGYAGLRLGWGTSECISFALGALFAEIGMTCIDKSILMGETPFNQEHRDEIQQHPNKALQFLRRIGVDDSIIINVVRQHHERWDGSGYPRKWERDRPRQFSRLFAVIDVFTAMRSDRPWRRAIPPHLAMEWLFEQSGTLFDPLMVEYLIKLLGVFPVGSLVDLTKSYAGVVYTVNEKNIHRPVVVAFPKKQRFRHRETPQDPLGATQFIIDQQNCILVDLSDEGTREQYGEIAAPLDNRRYNISEDHFLHKIS